MQGGKAKGVPLVGIGGDNAVPEGDRRRLAESVVTGIGPVGGTAVGGTQQQRPVVGIRDDAVVWIGHRSHAPQAIVGTLSCVGRPADGLVSVGAPPQRIILEADRAGTVLRLLQTALAIVARAVIGVDDVPAAERFLRAVVF